MKTKYTAQFPQYHSLNDDQWTFEWVNTGFMVSGMSRSFELTIENDHFLKDKSYIYFTEKAHLFLPGEFFEHLYFLWEKMSNEDVQESQVQEAFDALGEWCMSCNRTVPATELFNEYNGRGTLIA